MKIRFAVIALMASLLTVLGAGLPPAFERNAATTNAPPGLTNFINSMIAQYGASNFQRGSVNLTNWSLLSTNALGAAVRTNWPLSSVTNAYGLNALQTNNASDLSNLVASALSSGTVPLLRLGTNAATAGYALKSDGTTTWWGADETAPPDSGIDAATAGEIARQTMSTNKAGYVGSIATNPVPAANITGTIADSKLSTNVNSLGSVYNVRTYGAVGDGVTDDGAAIQAAMDAAGLAGGGVVWFPPGKYGVTDTTSYPTYLVEGARAPIIFRTNNVFLVGQDRNSCQIVSLAAVSSHAGYEMISGGPPDPQSAAGFTNFGIINMTIDASGHTDWYDMTQIYKTTNTIFRNVTFKNLGGTGDLLDIQFGGEASIDNCRFENFKNNALSGQNSSFVIRNCWIDCVGHNSTADILEVPGTGTLLVENTTFVNAVPITAASSGAYAALSSIYRNCNFYLTEHDSATFVMPTGTAMEFLNCAFYTQNSPEDSTAGPDAMTYPVIDTIGGLSLVVKGCNFGMYTYPMRIRAVRDNAQIVGNFFNGSLTGVVLYNAPCGILIEGNSFNTLNGFGVHADPTGTNCDNLQIIGNWFGPNCPNMRLASAGTNIQIRANQFMVNSWDLFGQLGANKIIATDNNSPSGSVTLATSGNILRGNKLGNLTVSTANAGIIENNIINQFGGSGGNYNSLKTNRNYKFDFTAWNVNDDNVGAYALASHNQPASTITNAGTLIYSNSVAMTNAGLQTAYDATNNIGAGHIKSGTIATARLGSGTANGTTVLRGDSTWGTAGVGDVVQSGQNNFTASNNFSAQVNVGTLTATNFYGPAGVAGSNAVMRADGVVVWYATGDTARPGSWSSNATVAGNFYTPITNAGAIGTDANGKLVLNQAVVTNMVDVRQFGAVGDGTTDDTTSFQNAINTGRPVFVPSTNFVVSNLMLTNGGGLFGYGARLTFKTGSTGYMITATNTDCFLYGLKLDGGETTKPTTLGSRHGIWVNTYGTNINVRDIRVVGFSGKGIYVYSTDVPNALNTYRVPVAKIANCEAWFCFSAFEAFSDANGKGEYGSFRGIDAHSCYYGAAVRAGNVKLIDSQFNYNTVGIWLDGDPPNAAHGQIVGCTINHNTFALVATNLAYGHLISGCAIWGGDVYVKDSLGLVIQDSVLDVAALTFNGTGYNSVNNCWYYGTFGNPITVTHAGGDLSRVTISKMDGSRVLGQYTFGTNNSATISESGDVSAKSFTGTGDGVTNTTGYSMSAMADTNWVADFVRERFNFGSSYYATTNIQVGATNADQPGQYVYQYYSAIETNNPGVRAYASGDFLTNSGYVGAVMTTNTFMSFGGTVVVNLYLGYAGGTGTRNLTLKPEIYYSYDRTNWYGDYSGTLQSIALGATNLYQWLCTFPNYTSTNGTGFYVQRRLKVGTVNGNATLYVLEGTNAVSGAGDASHLTMQSPTATSGNAYLSATQTFTGSNTFNAGVYASTADVGGKTTSASYGATTNLNYVRPDFALESSVLSTNASFTWLVPTNVLPTKFETCAVLVTNTSGSLITIARSSASVATNGTWNCTNSSMVVWYHWGAFKTNAFCIPID